MRLFLSPCCGDAILFGSFTILREKPKIIRCFDPAEPKLAEAQRREDILAASVLGADVDFLRLPETLIEEELKCRLRTELEALRDTWPVEHVWAPARTLAHPLLHHLLGSVACEVFPEKVTRYFTYHEFDRLKGITTAPILQADWLRLKLLAVACYGSLLQLEPRRHLFLNLDEYYG